MGPTASGKSQIALEIAKQTNAELISVDSMQVYRGMDIGTAKPSAAEQEAVRHHMIDIVDPSSDFTVAEFQTVARRVLDARVEGGLPVLVAGGSGLHMRALVDPLDFPPSDAKVRAEIDRMASADAVDLLSQADAEAGSVVDLKNHRRVQRALEILQLTGLTPTDRATSTAAVDVREYRPRVEFVGVGVDAGLSFEGEIRSRLTQMVGAGLLEEIEYLLPRLGRNARQAVGYKQLIPVVEGSVPIDDGLEAAAQATIGLAKRQRTFFRRDPRIDWIEWDADSDVRLLRAEAIIEKDARWNL